MAHSPSRHAPSSFALLDLMGAVELMAGPDLGNAIIDCRRVASHLPDVARLLLMKPATRCMAVLEQLFGEGYLVRVLEPEDPDSGSVFRGQAWRIATVRLARPRIEHNQVGQLSPQDRG